MIAFIKSYKHVPLNGSYMQSKARVTTLSPEVLIMFTIYTYQQIYGK